MIACGVNTATCSIYIYMRSQCQVVMQRLCPEPLPHWINIHHWNRMRCEKKYACYILGPMYRECVCRGVWESTCRGARVCVRARCAHRWSIDQIILHWYTLDVSSINVSTYRERIQLYTGYAKCFNRLITVMTAGTCSLVWTVNDSTSILLRSDSPNAESLLVELLNESSHWHRSCRSQSFSDLLQNSEHTSCVLLAWLTLTSTPQCHVVFVIFFSSLNALFRELLPRFVCDVWRVKIVTAMATL